MDRGDKVAWAAALTFCHCLSLSFTSYRIVHRYRRGQLWYDDAFALLAALCDVPYLVVLWFRFNLWNVEYTLPARVAHYYLSALPFFMIIWFSRIALALSFSRIFPHEDLRRKLGQYAAIIFGFFAAGLVIQDVAMCTSNTAWHHTAMVQCNYAALAWTTAVVCDLVGDMFLVIAPLRALWDIKLPPNPRRLILSIFSASICSFLASVALHSFLFAPQSWGPWRGWMILVLTHLEANICLLTSNMLVVATVYYRIFEVNFDCYKKPSKPPANASPSTLTSPRVDFTNTEVSLTTLDWSIPMGNNPEFAPRPLTPEPNREHSEWSEAPDLDTDSGGSSSTVLESIKFASDTVASDELALDGSYPGTEADSSTSNSSDIPPSALADSNSSRS